MKTTLDIDDRLLARAKWPAAVEGSAPWALPVFSIGEFVRVVTHVRPFHPPTGLDTALAFLAPCAESTACARS